MRTLFGPLGIFHMLLLFIAAAVLFMVPEILHQANLQHFENHILKYQPYAEFKYYNSEERTASDLLFLRVIWGFILSMCAVLLWQDFRLWKHRNSANSKKTELLKIFMIRVLVYIFMMIAFPLSLRPLEKGVYAGNLSPSDITMLSFMMMIPLMAFGVFPLLAQQGIGSFFKAKDALYYVLGMAIVLAVCFTLGIGRYSAPVIAAAVIKLPFAKRITASWAELDSHFGIAGKRFYEIFQ